MVIGSTLIKDELPQVNLIELLKKKLERVVEDKKFKGL